MLDVPIRGVISDGQHSIRKAVQAAKPVYEADRHAKTLLKMQLRGVRPIERALEEHLTSENEAICDYCLAVRSCLSDDGRSPLEASGLRLYSRIKQINDSVERVQEKKITPILKAVAPVTDQRATGDRGALATAGIKDGVN